MPYAANDDRFYDVLNRSGDQYRDDRYRVAEEQAAHTREMGQLYGQALPNTLNAAMKGADWSQNRDLGNQAYQQRGAQEGRAQAEEGRKVQQFGVQLPMYQDQATAARIALDQARQEQDYNAAPVGAEEASQVGYTGDAPLTHFQLGKLRGEQTSSLGLDQAHQNLANAKQAATATAQQIAQNATTFQNQQYNFEAQKAANELDDIYMIQDPSQQTQALSEWRARHSNNLLSPELLTNMGAAGATKRQAQISQNEANNAASTKLVYGSAIQEAQGMTQKLAATQELARDAKTYDSTARAGGLWENADAKDARENAALTLTSLGKHEAADQVRNGAFAQGRGLLSDQARRQASDTLGEFDEWYARQDFKVQQLPEVKRAYQQAQELKQQMQIPGGSPTLSKLPSLVGLPGSGNGAANAAFMTGSPAPGGNMSGAPPPASMTPSYFTQPPKTQMQPVSQPAPPPQQHFDPYQLQGGTHSRGSR